VFSYYINLKDIKKYKPRIIVVGDEIIDSSAFVCGFASIYPPPYKK